VGDSEYVFYNPFDSMSFTYDRCFLCGQALEDSSTDEHVFPKWLLHKYNLWDKIIYLINRTELPYRLMKIPCCSTCNNEYLSSLENEIKNAVEQGYDEFIKLDELKIFQWIAKIFYGILFRELSLLVERKDPSLGQITTPEMLERYKTLYVFLQSVRMPVDFNGTNPWSIFIVRCHSYDDDRAFDYRDGITTQTFTIRVGEIGVIACLEDSGVQKEIFSDYFKQFEGIRLHPIQFNELSAKVTYKGYLKNRTPSYICILPSKNHEKLSVMTSPVQGLSNAPIFDDWDQRIYAKFLEHHWKNWGLSFDSIFVEPDLVVTFLKNDDGSVMAIDKNTNHFKGASNDLKIIDEKY